MDSAIDSRTSREKRSLKLAVVFMYFAAPTLLTLVAFICSITFDDGFERISRRVSPELLPPVEQSQRTEWAVAVLSKGSDEAAVEAATRALALDLPASLAALEALSKHENWRVRTAAIDAGVRGASLVADAGDRTRLREIGLTAATDSVRAVRRNAARLLAEVGDGANPALKTLVCDPFFDVRIESIRALARGGSTDTMRWISERLNDPDRQVAELAVDVLPRLGLSGASELAPFVENIQSPLELRFRALRALRSEGTADDLGDALLQIVTRRSEDGELRALALALALTVGATFDPPEAVALLLPVALSASDLEHQGAAIDGLVALGPNAATSVRKALIDSRVPLYTFNRLLAALPAMARKDAARELQSLFDALTGEERDDERSAIIQSLGRHAPAGLAAFLTTRWSMCGATARREAVRVFMFRSDVTSEFCELALLDSSAEVRRAAFELALRTPEVSTQRCIEAVCRETEPSQYSEFLETLPRRRPEPLVRGFLLGLMKEADSEIFESLTSALDAFSKDSEVVQFLIDQHERAQRKQLSDDSEDSHTAWRVRRMAIRTIARIGGAEAIEFLRWRARSERSVDAQLAMEAIHGLSVNAPNDAVLVEFMDPPSLPLVRIEAAIAVTMTGKSQGLRTLARDVRLLNGDSRRRALNALARGRNLELRKGFLQLLALDDQAMFGDENRIDAIRDLVLVNDPDSLETLKKIAAKDRSLEARIAAIHGIGRNSSTLSASILIEIGDDIYKNDQSDERELLLESVAESLTETRSTDAIPWLLVHIFERSLMNARQHLLNPDVARPPFERRRIYDQEHRAARAFAKYGNSSGPIIVKWLQEMWRRGLFSLVDPTFLLDIADEWIEAIPDASTALSEIASASGQDLEPRFRALINRAQLTRDRRMAAILYDFAHALARSGAVERAFARLLGSAEAQRGRRPRVWLRCARLIARAEAAFSEMKPDEGTRFLEEAVRQGASDSRTLVEVSGAFHAHGQAARSKDVLSQAVAMAPSDPALNETLAWLVYELGDSEGALERFRRAETLYDDPNSARMPRLGAACALAALSRTNEAESVVRDCVREDPDLAHVISQSKQLERLVPFLETPPPDAVR